MGRLSTGLAFNEDHFGIDLSLAGSRLAIGARLDDAAGGNAGAVYVAQIPEPASCVLAALGALCLWGRLRRAR